MWDEAVGKSCEVCGEQAAYLLTVRVDIAGDKTSRVKAAQFWLCERCEVANRQVMAQDNERKRRIALRLVDHPSFMSHWRDWRGKKYWSPEEVEKQEEFDKEWDERALRERALADKRGIAARSAPVVHHYKK